MECGVSLMKMLPMMNGDFENYGMIISARKGVREQDTSEND
jgi:hypothetical protein